MKKIIFFFLLAPGACLAQRIHLNLAGGFSNYSGDLQSKMFTLDQSSGAFGAAVQYDLTNHISLLTGFNFGHLAAADRFNKLSLQPRNLSFQTNLFEWNVLAEYNFLDLEDHRFTPYVFAGLAVYHYNPYAFDSVGNKVYLKPLSTEGEGLSQYPDRKNYPLTQMAIPFGAGIKLRVTSNITLAYEIGFRKLFTDYLDDVSTRYIDPTILLNARGSEAVALSYRGGELKNGNTTYPVEGSVRGNSRYNDWYYLNQIKVIIAFGNNGEFGGGGGSRKGAIDCPKQVY